MIDLFLGDGVQFQFSKPRKFVILGADFEDPRRNLLKVFQRDQGNMTLNFKTFCIH